MFENEQSQGCLLFVDDEKSILRSLKRLFVPMGYEVLTASSGQEGLSMLETNDVDVVISDMRMPEMDGAAFLEQAAEKWPEIKRLLLTGYADIESAIAAINKGKIDAYLNKPWQEEQLERAVSNALEAKRLKALNTELEIKILAQNKKLEQLNQSLEQRVVEKTAELKDAYDTIQKSFQSSLEVLSTLVEMHERKHRGHCRRVAKLALALAEKIGLPKQQCQNIYFASLLHNIGKIGLPATIIYKAYTQLEHAERELIERTPLIGEAALMAYEPLQDIASIIATHRERYNGDGYPNKLSGEEIPVSSRILAVALDYMELQLGLLFDETLLAVQALDFIKNDQGQYYDPEVAKVFVDLIPDLPEQQELLDERVLAPENLEPGMCLSRDLVTEYGMLLLPKDQVLADSQIQIIKRIGDIMVYVKAD